MALTRLDLVLMFITGFHTIDCRRITPCSTSVQMGPELKLTFLCRSFIDFSIISHFNKKLDEKITEVLPDFGVRVSVLPI